MDIGFRLSVCPSFHKCYVRHISKTVRCMVFKYYRRIKLVLNMCNVVVLSEQIENCQNYQILKIYRLSAFSTQCVLCPGCFSEPIVQIIFKIHIMIIRLVKKTSLIRLKKIIKDCQNYRILKIYEDFVHIWLHVQSRSGSF